MAIRIKIKEGSINFRQSTGQIGRATEDVPGNPDRTRLSNNLEEDSLDEKRKKRKKKKKKKKKGKKDRCYRIAKRKYDVFPSAYASGAIVKCRQGKIWRGLKEALTEDKFEKHMMYNPKTGHKKMTVTHEEHVALAKKGYTHVDPKALKKVFKDEGGAAGMKPFVKATKANEDEIEDTLEKMPKVGKHEDGDFIRSDGKQIKVVNEGIKITISESETLDEKKKSKRKKSKRKKAGTESSKESSLRDWFGRKGAKGKKSGWVDCNAPDGKGGYKACGREKGEKRKKYPACRPTPAACKERGKGKSWGKKAKKGKKG